MDHSHPLNPTSKASLWIPILPIRLLIKDNTLLQIISSITFKLLNADQSCSPTCLINISHSVQWNIQQTEVAFPRFELRFEIDRVSETKKGLSIFYTLVEFLSFKQENITPECWRKLSCANLKSYFILKLFFGYGHTKLEKNMMPPVKIRLIPCRSSTLAGRNRPCSKKFSHFSQIANRVRFL